MTGTVNMATENSFQHKKQEFTYLKAITLKPQPQFSPVWPIPCLNILSGFTSNEQTPVNSQLRDEHCSDTWAVDEKGC